MRPLAPLPELAAHEEELLAGMGPHVAEEKPQVRELLPAIARHLRDERALAVHHLVVRERKDEVLGERVPEGEGERVVVVAAMDGIVGEVVERVVHPAHVPFHREAQAPREHGARDARPRSRFLRDGERVREVAADRHVHLLQELDRVEVLLAAVRVRNPLAVLAPVVEVQHRGDRVHAQSVHVVSLEPEVRARREECAHLVAAVVEDGTLPLGMETQPRVRMLVEMRAVESREAVRIVREVRRHPVEDHADAGLVQRVDEVHAILRRAVARGGREVARGLVSPGAVERMLGDGHELHVREAHLRHVVGEMRGDVAIVRQRPVRAPPRSQVKLVDAQGRVHRVVLVARAHPLLVAPFVIEAPRARRAGRCHFRVERERVCTILLRALARRDGELVRVARSNSGDIGLPDARVVPTGIELVDAGFPAVPFADDGNVARVGRPDRDVRAVGVVAREELAAQALVERRVRSLAEEVDVLVGEDAHFRRSAALPLSAGGAGSGRAWKA